MEYAGVLDRVNLLIFPPHGVTGAENQEKGRQRQSSLLVMLILVRQILISVRILERLQVITLLWYFSQHQVAGGFRKPFCHHLSSSTGLAMGLQNSRVAMIFKTEQAFHQGVKVKTCEARKKHILCSVVPLGTFPEFRQVSMDFCLRLVSSSINFPWLHCTTVHKVRLSYWPFKSL